MRNVHRVPVVLSLALLVVAASVCGAQVPQKMDYQVMLTDASNEPIASQSVQLVFRIYTASAGGSQLWTEVQNVTTNSIGVASVILGAVTPLAVEFTAPRWLQVEVNGEVMTPRRELVAAPYARQAHNADNLGGTAAASFTLATTLSTAGTINAPANPVDWTKLKSVPSGFSDGVDNAGVGDGNSLDAPDGSPVNAIYVEADGDVIVGGVVPMATPRFAVESPSLSVPGVAVHSAGQGALPVAVLSKSDSTSAVVGNSLGSIATYTVPTYPAAVAGIGWRDSKGGFFNTFGSGEGVYVYSAGPGHAINAASGTGYTGYFHGGKGVYVERSDGYPALQVANQETGSYGDGLYVSSANGALSGTWALMSSCYQGQAGRFVKSADDGNYAVVIYGYNSSAPGLYVYGNIEATGTITRAVETSRGREASFAVTAPAVEVMASGSGRLSGGAARVEFDRLFAESVTGAADLRVTATPIGAWSALYVESVDGGGFALRSDAGAADVAFNWVAVGRSKDHERAADIVIPDPIEDARIAQEKAAAIEAARPATRNAAPETVTSPVGN